MNLSELKKNPVPELIKIAASVGIDNVSRSRKQDIIFSILKSHAKSGEDIYGDGVLEILQDGFGFLRSAESSYLAGPDDIFSGLVEFLLILMKHPYHPSMTARSSRRSHSRLFWDFWRCLFWTEA